MRTNKELIQILIDNFHLFEEYRCLGLCIYIDNLYFDNILVNISEKKRLDLIIKENIILKKWYNIFNWGKPNFIKINKGGYYWESDLKEPRLKYLNFLLNKYENEN